MADEVENKEQEKPAQPASNGWQIINFDSFKNPPIWLAAAVYLLAALLALAVLFLTAVGLYATFQIAYESVTGELKDRVEAAKVFFPILLALVGGPLLIWRVVTAHVQATAARHQADVAQEGLYTSLFTRAVEQLGATREVKIYEKIKGTKKREAATTTEPNLEVRLGAIYALDRVARDSERDHWPIIEVLCAYIRNPQNCGTPKIRPEDEPGKTNAFTKWLYEVTAPRVDVQAAISVIGRRDSKRIEFEKSHGLALDLSGANLQKADFSDGNFSGAHFFDAHLEWTSFNNARLEEALFMGAHCDIAVFDGAHLENASLEDGNFYGAMFGGAHLENAAFTGADLRTAMLNTPHLDGTWLFGTDLTKTLVYQSPLELAMGDVTTKLAGGVTRPAMWADRELTWQERAKLVADARGRRKD